MTEILRASRHILTLRRLLIGLGLFALAVFLLSLRNFHTLQEIDDETQLLYGNEFFTISHVMEANTNLFDIERKLKRAILSQSSAERSSAIESLVKNEESLQQEIALAKQGITRNENRMRLSALEGLYAEYRKNIGHALSMMERRDQDAQGDSPGAYVLSEDFQKVVSSADKLLDEIAASKQQLAFERMEHMRTLNAQGRLISLLILATAVIIVLVSGIYFKYSLVNPLQRLKTSIDEMAAGRADIGIPYAEQPNYVGDIARSIEQVRAHLKGLIVRVQDQARIARAVPSDVERVVQMIAENAQDGPFVGAALTAERQQELSLILRQALGSGVTKRVTWENKVEVVPEEFWVYKVAGELAAFALVHGLNNKQGLERELHALAVRPAYRGQGIGARMLDFFCREFTGRDLFMQCKPGSQMLQMAMRRGFTPCGKIADETLLKRPGDFGAQTAANRMET